MLNLLNIAACSPKVHIGNPKANYKEILTLIDRVKDKASVIVFPELSITGYTCADLFNQESLLSAARWELTKLVQDVPKNTLVFVGLPLAVNGILYNVAAAIYNNEVIGIIPKKNIPNYKEFYEYRWFQEFSKGVIHNKDFNCPMGSILFDVGGTKIGVEICEDLWVPIPPSSLHSINGAKILINLSASNETVGKSDYRRELVKNQSARCVAAYVYCSAGPTESTTDLVFGGHNIIAENGSILQEGERFKDENYIIASIDCDKLETERLKNRSLGQQYQAFKDFDTYEVVNINVYYNPIYRSNPVNKSPFVPSNPKDLNDRCEEIFNIQVCALKKRIVSAGVKNIHIGVSGGLDSTLALLVAQMTCSQLKESNYEFQINGYSLPGFGTSDRTKNNAESLMTELDINQATIDIKTSCFDMFKSIGHKPFGIDLNDKTIEGFQKELSILPENNRKDLVFENVQARMRTLVLMSKGFVLGTGDLSELALGFCTYNADHMSMYNPNCSVPKTLVKFLVNWIAENKFEGKTREILKSIVTTEISPELLPVIDGKIQNTEDTIGPYELNDFFLFNMLRYGFDPYTIRELASSAFADDEKINKFAANANLKLNDYIRQCLKEFYKKFFIAQFKRTCVPDGPKIGSVSLSPRGDWRMPTDADAELWVNT